MGIIFIKGDEKIGITPTILLFLAISAPNMLDDVVVIEDECIGCECEETDLDTDVTTEEGLNTAEYGLNETFAFDVFEYTFL